MVLRIFEPRVWCVDMGDRPCMLSTLGGTWLRLSGSHLQCMQYDYCLVIINRVACSSAAFAELNLGPCLHFTTGCLKSSKQGLCSSQTVCRSHPASPSLHKLAESTRQAYPGDCCQRALLHIANTRARPPTRPARLSRHPEHSLSTPASELSNQRKALSALLHTSGTGQHAG